MRQKFMRQTGLVPLGKRRRLSLLSPRPLRQHEFALRGGFRYMVHNYIPDGVRPR